MFRKKEKNNPKEEVAAQIHDDLIVHNMPSQAKIVGSKYLSPDNLAAAENVSSNNFSAASGEKPNFKIVGLLIIIAGIIVVAGLAYASYYFIIKPTAQKNETANGATIIKKEALTATSTATSTVASSTFSAVTVDNSLIATMTPEILDSTSLSASSTATTTASLDTDADGLYDDEELILGINSALTDSDFDGYGDAAELNNGYNPAGSGLMKTNTQLVEYSNSVTGYKVLYPKNWSFKSLNADYTVVFTSPDNSLIQISVQSNSDKQSILAWYENSFPGVAVTYDKLKSFDNWDGIESEDNLNFYLTNKEHRNIYVLSYIPAVDDRVAYPNIFKLMINSLVTD
jgi:heme/copper-type cytochrome/quinol oxidase subunit 2